MRLRSLSLAEPADNWNRCLVRAGGCFGPVSEKRPLYDKPAQESGSNDEGFKRLLPINSSAVCTPSQPSQRAPRLQAEDGGARLGGQLRLDGFQGRQVAPNPLPIIAAGEFPQTFDARFPSLVCATIAVVMLAIQEQRHLIVDDPPPDTGDQVIQPPVVERYVDLDANPQDQPERFAIEAHGLAASDAFYQGILKAWGPRASVEQGQQMPRLVDDLRRSRKQERPLAVIVAPERSDEARELVG